MITCGKTVDEAAFLFIALDCCCHEQMLANTASWPGWEKIPINKEDAEFTHKKSGNSNKIWLAFQPYMITLSLKIHLCLSRASRMAFTETCLLSKENQCKRYKYYILEKD
jgi:hypothetical protein